jgi:phosphonate transport system permease protein
VSGTAAARGWGGAATIAMRTVGVVVAVLVVVQSLIVVEARPQDLITGFHGMVDIIRRATPPDFSKLPDVAWPALETVDIAIFGTLAGVMMALPLAVLAARNVTPSRALYYLSRGTIGFTRAVPDLVWALFFVTAVGLGPFPGGLALAVHSIGMLGRLFAETIENMDMAPIDALALTGPTRCRCSPMASCRRCCRRCWALGCIGWTRTSVRRWCWASSAPAGSGSSC